MCLLWRADGDEEDSSQEDDDPEAPAGSIAVQGKTTRNVWWSLTNAYRTCHNQASIGYQTKRHK